MTVWNQGFFFSIPLSVTRRTRQAGKEREKRSERGRKRGDRGLTHPKATALVRRGRQFGSGRVAEKDWAGCKIEAATMGSCRASNQGMDGPRTGYRAGTDWVLGAGSWVLGTGPGCATRGLVCAGSRGGGDLGRWSQVRCGALQRVRLGVEHGRGGCCDAGSQPG